MVTKNGNYGLTVLVWLSLAVGALAANEAHHPGQGTTQDPAPTNPPGNSNAPGCADMMNDGAMMSESLTMDPSMIGAMMGAEMMNGGMMTEGMMNPGSTECDPVQAAATTGIAITSAPLASTNPANIGQALQFSIAANSDTGAELSFSWDFGDGTTAAGVTASHAYSAAGMYLPKAVITDGTNTVTSSLCVMIHTEGSMTISAMSGSMPAATVDKGSITVAGTLMSGPSDLALDQQIMHVEVAGMCQQFTLDAKGTGRSEDRKAKIQIKRKERANGTSAFRFSMRGSLVPMLSNAGIDETLAAPQKVSLPVRIEFGGAHFVTVYTGTANWMPKRKVVLK